jgi:hypothetical protein
VRGAFGDPDRIADPAKSDARVMGNAEQPLERVDAAWDARNERERLRDEARYRRESLELYRARLYSGPPASKGRGSLVPKWASRPPLNVVQ